MQNSALTPSTTSYFISCLRTVFTISKYSNTTNLIPWSEIYQLSNRHNVCNVLYHAIQQLPPHHRPAPSIMSALEQQASLHIVQDTYQQLEVQQLFQLFEEKQIPAIALKGMIMKRLYPRPDLRSMTDIDLAIREEDAVRIKQIMLQQGYTILSYGQGKHDTYTKEPYVTVEMHRRIPMNKNAQEAYFKNVWTRCAKLDSYNYIYCLNVEDFYIHLISHMAEHMVNGGIGIRFFIDLWIYKTKYSETWDREYLTEGLQNLNLEAFADKAQHMAEVWFGEAEREAGDESLEEFIINCGIYGNKDVFVIANKAMKNVQEAGTCRQKAKYIFRRAFPEYEWMEERFPAVEKSPWLLPIYWVYRLYHNGFRRIGAVQGEFDSLKDINQEQITQLENLYHAWGLDRELWEKWH